VGRFLDFAISAHSLAKGGEKKRKGKNGIHVFHEKGGGLFFLLPVVEGGR